MQGSSNSALPSFYSNNGLARLRNHVPDCFDSRLDGAEAADNWLLFGPKGTTHKRFLGDIDLVVMTAPRPMSREEWHRRLDALNAKAEAAGKEYWPGRDLKLRLRNRNRHLSFHPEFDLRDSDDRKVIFSSPIEAIPNNVLFEQSSF